MCHGRQPLRHRVRVLAQMLGRVHAARQLPRQHKRGVERHHDQRLVAGRLDQPFDHAQRYVKARFRVQRNLRPVVGGVDRRCGRQTLLVLNLDKVHPRSAEILQVLVHCGLAFMVAAVEVHEEGRRGGIQRRAAVNQIKQCLALIHPAHSFLVPDQPIRQ